MTIDENIGAIIKAQRVQLGLSQQALAALIGVTFQQVQKYEKGNNALNAKKLLEFAKALKMPVASFFAQFEQPSAANSSDREALELAKSFNTITDYNTRKKLADLARAIAEAAQVRA